MLVAVLLGLTVIVAAVAPRDDGTDGSPPPPPPREQPAQKRDATAEASPGTAPRPERGTPGVDMQFRLREGARPGQLRAKLGDEIRLIVSSRKPNSVEIPGLDISEAVDLAAPLELDLRMERRGSFPITLGPGGPRLGVLAIDG